MLTSAFTIRRPHPSYQPAGWEPPKEEGGLTAVSNNVTVDAAMKTPQFFCLLSVFFCVATGGMGLFSVAKPMVGEVFSGALPAIVTASFASSFLLLMSGGTL